MPAGRRHLPGYYIYVFHKQKMQRAKITCCILKLCPEQDSNLHSQKRPPGPQPGVSTNSTIWANCYFKNRDAKL